MINLFYENRLLLAKIADGVIIVRLKELRNERGLSQQKLADAIGTNQQSIHRYEHENHEPDIQTLKTLADFFDTSIDYLVGNTYIRYKAESIDQNGLTEDETLLIEKYRKLTVHARRSVIVMIDALLENAK